MRQVKSRCWPEDEVVADRIVQDQGAVVAVLGDVGQPGLVAAIDRVLGDLAAADLDAAAVGPAQPDNRLDQLALPVALDAGDAEDLAGAHRQRHAAHRRRAARAGDVEVAHLEHGVADLGRSLLDAQQDRAPDHGARDVGGRQPAALHLGHHRAAAHDRDPVGDGEHLVELVGDEHDGHALGHQAAQHVEQVAHLARREHRGRLVEDEDVAAAPQHLEDLDALLLADRELLDARRWIHVEPELVRQLADLRGRRGQVEQAAAARLVAQHHVLHHGERADQHEVLVHHAHAARDRLRHRVLADLLALDPDLAAVGLHVAVGDLHQRGLAGAVLADQRVDALRRYTQAHVVIGVERPVALDDAAQIERCRALLARGRCRGVAHGRRPPVTRPAP